MGFLDYILTDITASLGQFTMIGPRFSWIFLASAIVIALICYRRDRSEKWSASQAFKQTFPSKVLLHPSALLDYRYAVANYFVRVLAFGVFMISGAGVAAFTQQLFTRLFGEVAPDIAQAGVLVAAGTAILLVLALDFGLFFAHFLMHKFPVLWEFHKVHHSAEMLTPITVLRMHPVDMIINSWIVAICVGAVNGAYGRCCTNDLALGTRPTEDGIQAVRSKLGRPSPVIRLSTRTPILA
ncbi:MAG: sterol desaturase/sphingolipid hydroxylase (fatty acid hydroxylase superfamily), partial [Paracoccaceae bacterium]